MSLIGECWRFFLLKVTYHLKFATCTVCSWIMFIAYKLFCCTMHLICKLEPKWFVKFGFGVKDWILSMLFAKICNIFFIQLLIEMFSFIVWTQSLLWHLEAITTPQLHLRVCCALCKHVAQHFFLVDFLIVHLLSLVCFMCAHFLSLCLNVNPMHILCPCTLKSLNDFFFVHFFLHCNYCIMHFFIDYNHVHYANLVQVCRLSSHVAIKSP